MCHDLSLSTIFLSNIPQITSQLITVSPAILYLWISVCDLVKANSVKASITS